MASQKEAIKGILEGIEEFIQNHPLNGFKRNKTFQPLLVPKYRDSGEMQRIYHISQSDFNAIQDYIESFDVDVLLLQTNLKARDLGYSTLRKIQEKMNDKTQEDSIKIIGDTKQLEAKNVLRTLDTFFHSAQQKFDRFESLQDEICHFEKFSSTLDFSIVEEMNAKIKEIVEAKTMEEREDLESKGVPKEYIETILQAQQNEKRAEVYGYVLDSSLQEHYYSPLVIDNNNDSRIVYAIREPSEREFLQDLQKYLQENNNALKQYEWCFSKIVENVDSIYIPYFDSQNQAYRKFYPDFIFWLRHKQSKEYKIIFIDPKGLRLEANARYKLRGFKDIFEKNSLHFDNLPIEVFLFYYNKQNYPISNMQNHIKSTIAELFI